jgi:hypothetical protein
VSRTLSLVIWIPALLLDGPSYSHSSRVVAVVAAVATVLVDQYEDESTGISVIVGLVPSATIHLEQYGTIDRIIFKAEAYAMTVPDEATLERLQNHPGVEYVSHDGMTDPMTVDDQEQVGWGMHYIQAMSDLIPAAAPASQQSDGSCFRMCIVDGGLLVNHPDIPYSRYDPRLQGQEFGFSENWFEPRYHHGTHVAVRYDNGRLFSLLHITSHLA